MGKKESASVLRFINYCFFIQITQTWLPVSGHTVRSLDCPRSFSSTAPDRCTSTGNSERGSTYHPRVEIPVIYQNYDK